MLVELIIHRLHCISAFNNSNKKITFCWTSKSECDGKTSNFMFYTPTYDMKWADWLRLTLLANWKYLYLNWSFCMLLTITIEISPYFIFYSFSTKCWILLILVRCGKFTFALGIFLTFSHRWEVTYEMRPRLFVCFRASLRIKNENCYRKRKMWYNLV